MNNECENAHAHNQIGDLRSDSGSAFRFGQIEIHPGTVAAQCNNLDAPIICIFPSHRSLLGERALCRANSTIVSARNCDRALITIGLMDAQCLIHGDFAIAPAIPSITEETKVQTVRSAIKTREGTCIERCAKLTDNGYSDQKKLFDGLNTARINLSRRECVSQCIQIRACYECNWYPTSRNSFERGKVHPVAQYDSAQT